MEVTSEGRVAVDKEALDRSIARRLLDHSDGHTSDMAAGVLELPADS